MTQDTREDSTDIIVVEVTDDGETVDLSAADSIDYELSSEVGGGSTVISKTDSDSTVYTQDADVDTQLENILPDGLSDVDLSSGKFVVEITPDEMPEAGDYAEEVRASWSSPSRSFVSEPRVVSVGRQATTN